MHAFSAITAAVRWQQKSEGGGDGDPRQVRRLVPAASRGVDSPETRKATSRKRRCDVSPYQFVPLIILIINQGRKKKFIKKKKRNERKGKGKRRRNVVSMNSRIPAGLVGFFLSTDERERADLFRIIYETSTCLPFNRLFDSSLTIVNFQLQQYFFLAQI